MDPLHLYVVSIVCGGRESQRGVFLKRALGASDFCENTRNRRHSHFRKCASGSPWRGEGMFPLFRNCALRLASSHRKRGSASAVAHDPRGRPQKMCVVSVPAGSDGSFLANRDRTRIFRNPKADSGWRRGRATDPIVFAEDERLSRPSHNAHFRKSVDAHFRK
jgi:hypothetical protein